MIPADDCSIWMKGPDLSSYAATALSRHDRVVLSLETRQNRGRKDGAVQSRPRWTGEKAADRHAGSRRPSRCAYYVILSSQPFFARLTIGSHCIVHVCCPPQFRLNNLAQSFQLTALVEREMLSNTDRDGPALELPLHIRRLVRGGRSRAWSFTVPTPTIP